MLERLENDLELVRGDADARVGHGESDDAGRAVERFMVGTPTSGGHPHTQTHFALLGEFEGVGEQVAEDLLQSFRIAVNGWGQAGGKVDAEVEPLVLCHRHKGPFHILLQFRKGQLAQIQGHGAGFDLGHVEDVVDKGLEVGAGRINSFGEFDLLRGEVALGVVGEHLRQNEQAVERGAQLVRHVGQEFGFVLRGQG